MQQTTIVLFVLYDLLFIIIDIKFEYTIYIILYYLTSSIFVLCSEIRRKI